MIDYSVIHDMKEDSVEVGRGRGKMKRGKKDSRVNRGIEDILGLSEQDVLMH